MKVYIFIITLFGLLGTLLFALNIYLHSISASCDDQVFEYETQSINKPSINELSTIAESCLIEERAIYTYPSINSDLIKRVYGIRLPDYVSNAASNLYAIYINVTTSKHLTGGIILYDYNFSRKNIIDKKMIKGILKKGSKRFYLKNTTYNTKYEIIISPFIVADCIPYNVPITYCRGMPAKEQTIKEIEKRSIIEDYVEYIEYYKDLGIISSLGPAVDFYASEFENVDELNEFTYKTTKEMAKRNFIPVLKHFIYDGSIGDSHYTFSVNDISEEDLSLQLSPYRLVENTSIPYMIMTTHQALGPLDSQKPATQSETVYQYIKNNFPNALILADSISMKGMLGNNFYSKIINGKANVYIIHLGLYHPWLKLINSKRGLKNTSHSIESIEKILELKRHYNLLKITKID